jgi:hypothetical protein
MRGLPVRWPISIDGLRDERSNLATWGVPLLGRRGILDKLFPGTLRIGLNFPSIDHDQTVDTRTRQFRG